MERESFGEDGLPTTAPLLKEVSANGSQGSSVMSPSDCAVTPLLVFSTLIAVSGSFVFGCTVSTVSIFFYSDKVSLFSFMIGQHCVSKKISGFSVGLRVRIKRPRSVSATLAELVSTSVFGV